MKRSLSILAALVLAAPAMAQRIQETNDRHIQLFPDRDHAPEWARGGGGGQRGQNLSYHGGAVLLNARVVAIFWGPSWGGSDAATMDDVTGFFGQFGTTGEYNVITQYTDGSGNHINLVSSLLADSWWDSSNPPTNATDAVVQGEVQKYINARQGGLADPSTVYEVFLPATSYASFGTYTSCGGPNLYFCAYHGNFSYNGRDVKYASMPNPSCSGCQSSGWTAAQNFDHFSCHETREAVTDADGTAWYDRQGNEADDKCAWSPSPFLDGGYGYQYEWSNAAGACVQKLP
jgi:hypothetical protein